jgi:hypothetical protein
MSDSDLIPPVESGQGPAKGSRPLGGAPDYRQIQQPAEGLEPWRLQSSGAQERAAALGTLFKGFEGESAGILDKLEAQRGKQQGAAAGTDPNFAPKTGLQAVTAFGENYNAAAHSTYITSSQLSLEQHLTDIEKNNVGNPDGFQQQAGAVVDAATKAMDPLYKPEMTNWALARIQAGTNRQELQKQTDVRNTALATYQSATPDLITAALHTAAALPGPQGDAVIAKLHNDDVDRLNALVASRTITPEQANTMHQKMVADADSQFSGQKVDTSLQPILASMRSNVEAADKLIIQPDPNLTPAENTARQAEFEKDRSQYVQTQTRAHVDDLNNAHQALAAGSYGAGIEGTVRGLYKAGALSEEGYFSATAESLRNQRGALEDDASLQLVDAAVHGDGPRLDPKDPAAKAAADKYFQAHVAMAGGIGDAQYGIGASQFVQQTGIVPKSVQGQIRIGLLSGDPTNTVRAAGLAAKISAQNPEADVYQGTPRLAALAGLVNDNTAAGLAPAQALAMARATTDITPEQLKLRNTRYAADAKATNRTDSDALTSILQARDGGLFTHAPVAPPGMQAAYSGLVRQFYGETGDIGKARDMAGKQLQTTWGVSKVNGDPEYMQHPVPDSLVPTVRADIASSVKDAGYAGDPSAIHLTPNESTVPSQGRSWTLTHADSVTGAPDVVLDKNNQPMRYDVPSPQNFAKAQQDLAAQKINAARAQRDQNRQNSTDADRVEAQLSSFYLDPKNRMSTLGR